MTPEEFAQLQREIAARHAEQIELLRSVELHARRLVLIVAVIGVGWLLSLMRW